MNFENAALLILAVFGMVEFGKRFLGPRLASDSRIIALLALVVGQAATWLLSTTAWAHEQVIGSKHLDELNAGSLILVGLLVAGVAAFGSETLKTVRNIGQNEPTPVQQAALDAGAERLVKAQMRADAGGTHP